MRSKPAPPPDQVAEADQTAVDGWTRPKVILTAGLMACLLMSAMDSTIVGTALPTIAGQLGDASLYSWVVSAYLLTGTTTVPVWGRLADHLGRKRILLIGLTLFVAGSLLCGLAPSMLALVLFRGLQGIGAGCLQPIAMTVIGDVFPLEQRARVQGLFSGMWGLAAVLGPLLGALFVATIGWRWIFDVNLPIGLVSAVLVLSYREHVQRRGGRRLDFAGAALLTAAVALILYGLSSTVGRGSGPTWGLMFGGLLLLTVFLVRSRGRHEAIVPLWLIADRVIGPAMAATVLGGALMFVCTTYAPLYVQGVLGGTAINAGFAVAPMSIGWPLAAVVGGRILIRVGYRALAVTGALAIIPSSLMLYATSAALGQLWISASMLFIGIGLGLLLTPLLVAVQDAVNWQNRGAVTALNQFSRTMGGVVFVSSLGLMLQAQEVGRIRLISAALDPVTRARLSAGTLAQATAALNSGLHLIFAAVVVMSLALLIAALFSPSGIGSRSRPGA